MCIMEVRPGQHSSTIAQAMAHNISTVERDLDMYEKLLQARGELIVLGTVQKVHGDLRKCYESLLDIFGTEVGSEVKHWHHAMPDESGNERASIKEVARHDAELARRYETR